MKKALVFAAAGVLALTLSACAAGQPPQTAAPNQTSGAPSGPAGSAPSGAGWDINPQPYEAIKDGGTFTGVYGSQLTTWNLATATGNDGELKIALSPLSEGYMFTDGAGNLTVNPNFLTDLKEDASTGKTVITMQLNPKATWSGTTTPISADDWIATWKALNGSDKNYQAASTDGWDSIESMVQGASPQEVIITFKTLFPDWRMILVDTQPMPVEACKDAKTFNDGWGEYKQEWFSGPFVVSNFDKTSGMITMTPSSTWWGEKPKLDKVVMKMVKPEGMATAFANHEIDYIDIGPDASYYALAKGATNSAIRVSEGSSFRQFTFNSKSPILSDQAVRQAIVMGLDRATIAASDLAGLPVDPKPLNNNLFMEGQDGYVDLGQATGIDFNVDKANQTLDAAGWTLNASTGIREKDGKPLAVTFAVLGGVKASENEGLQAQKMLKVIGVDLKLNVLDANKDWPGVLTSHNFDIVAFSWLGTPFPLAFVGQIYGESSYPEGSNFAQLTIPQVETLLPQLASESDPAQRLVLGQQAAQAIWEAVHTLPLYQRPSLVGVPANVANIGALGLASRPLTWTNIGYVS